MRLPGLFPNHVQTARTHPYFACIVQPPERIPFMWRLLLPLFHRSSALLSPPLPPPSLGMYAIGKLPTFQRFSNRAIAFSSSPARAAETETARSCMYVHVECSETQAYKGMHFRKVLCSLPRPRMEVKTKAPDWSASLMIL